MIIATAGHIDHGKSVLVKALTGIDTDRLPEEKSRGMSIDIGFAYAVLGNGDVLGFVDVPGHERFVRNMLAGVTGIDLALLVVAADDGPMPQTAEHLAILDLLGVSQGAVAVTKTDRVEPDRVTGVMAQVSDLLAGTALAGAPVFPVSAPTGDGIDDLRTYLERKAAGVRARAQGGGFRLAVDRSFVVRGSGLVVTGTVFSGQVAVDDTLVVSPAGLTARVRGIHAQNRESRTGGIGQRVALNIAGSDIARDRVGRGDWLVAPDLHAPTRRIDTRLRLVAEEGAPLRHGTPVHVHLGAADVTGRVALLSGRQLAPGESGFAQLVLDAETVCACGDRFILRDRSARRTVAGGTVLDSAPPARGRGRPDRLAVLAALQDPDPAVALSGVLAASPSGVDLAWFRRVRNLGAEEAEALWTGADMVRAESRGFATARWQDLAASVLGRLADPGDDAEPRGYAENRLRRAVDPPLSQAVLSLVLDRLAAEKQVSRAGGFVRLPGEGPTLSAADAKLWDQVRPMVAEGGTRPPRVRELAEILGLAPDVTERFLVRMAGAGLLRRVSRNRFYPHEAIRELAAVAEALTAETGEAGFDARAFRDRSGIGRNLTIEVLEYFDSVGFTRRRGDRRQTAKPAEAVFADVAPA